jgi:hypothetical protein
MRRKVLMTAAAEPMAKDGAIQVEVTLPVRARRHESGKGGQPESVSAAGSRSRIPRITRLMALAIKFQDMVDRGDVRDYADLARLGYVTRARITQIMNLLNLAPSIQEQILWHQRKSDGVAERHLRAVTSEVSWHEQRRLWYKISPNE